MCFETSESAKAKIAEKDIKCFKFLAEDYSALCFLFNYKMNQKTKNVILKIVESEESGTGFAINKGYHSYIDPSSAPYWLRSSESKSVYNFIIPAGARYFENETEYVSETIMLVE